MSEQQLVFNGIDGSTGNYLLPPLTPRDISALAQGKPLEEDPQQLRMLQARSRRETEATFAPIEGVDPDDLAEAGWGVIFAYNADPAVREALGELLDYRRMQASARKEQRYREFTGGDGARLNESGPAFLARRGAGGGTAVDPDKMPYYLLLVGSPEEIPFKFQYGLDVQHAVGRIHFETLDEYAQYARSVVLAEKGEVKLPRRARFVGVQNSDDRATNLSATLLVKLLAEKVGELGWDVQTILKEDAHKARLHQLLGSPDTPALLFTASHGIGFPPDDPRQLAHQGALLCQNWPGPLQWQGHVPQDFYLAGDDIGDDARLLGLITFLFACYGGGTPRWDDFAHRGKGERAAIAPHAFVARLPQRLLGHPRGGALAVIAHVERAWGYSFSTYQDGKSTEQVQDFQSTLTRLMNGQRVGWAMEFFNSRYANLSTVLTSELEDIKYNKIPDDLELARMWTANNDARGYAIIGDPAVRLPLADAPEQAAGRPEILAITRPATPQPPAPTATPPASTPAVPANKPPAGAAGVSSAAVDMSAPAAGAGDAPNFGLGDTLRDAQAALGGALQQFMRRLGEALTEAATLNVRTFVYDEGSSGQGAGSPTQAGAQLRAATRVYLSGDMENYIPRMGGEVDQTLWKIHTDLVAQAQANRNEVVKLAVSTVSGLINPIK